MKPPWNRELALLAGVILLAAAVRLPGLLSRGIWYDETISLLETSGHAAPSWPRGVVPARVSQQNFAGSPSLGQVTADLRETDTHPPLYFWILTLWRAWLGFGLGTARALSLVFSLGSVAVLFLLLRAADYEHPLGATLFYALATGAVHNGHEARPYALAELLLLAAALFGYVAVKASPDHRARAAASSAGMAVCCGAAFATNYLALLPIGALLAWYAWNLRRAARVLALTSPLLAAALGALTVPTLLAQMGTRSHQFTGFVGPLREVLALVRMNAQQTGVALSLSGVARSETNPWVVTLTTAAVVSVLAALTLAALRRGRPEAPKRLWTLLGVLASAPSAGLFVLDLAFDKRLHEARYLSFAVPALAVILTHGVLSLVRTKRRWGVALFVALLVVQATRLNWGGERCVRDQTGSLARGLAQVVEGIDAPSRVVAVAAGVGRGDPGTWIYELGPDTPVLVFGIGDDFDEIVRSIDGAADVWITFASDKLTFLMEEELIRRLEATGRYLKVFRSQVVCHLVRLPPA